MNKESLAQSYSEASPYGSETYTNNELRDVEVRAFLTGFGAAEPKWIPVSAGPPNKDASDSNDTPCIVWLNGGIEALSYNQYHQCWDHFDGDDYRCDFSECLGYYPIPDSLLNFKP